MVSAVNSPVSGLVGFGPAGSSGRLPVAPADGTKTNSNFFQGKLGGDAGASASNNNANLAGLASGGFAAQAFAQENLGYTIATATPRSPRQVAAAYQTTENQTDPGSVSDIQLPGLPARLASGRTLDLTA